MKKSPLPPLAPSAVVQQMLDRKKEIQDEMNADRRRLANSFEAVFAQPRKRNEHQQRVLEYLETCAGWATNDFDFLSPTDGVKCVSAGIHRDGAKSILRVIHRQLENATVKPKKPNA